MIHTLAFADFLTEKHDLRYTRNLTSSFCTQLDS